MVSWLAGMVSAQRRRVCDSGNWHSSGVRTVDFGMMGREMHKSGIVPRSFPPWKLLIHLAMKIWAQIIFHECRHI